MNIVVFGASGRVGTRVVDMLLDKGYVVTAFVHGAHSFSSLNNLKIIQGDIYNKSDIESAVAGSDAVISALGSWGTKRKDILSSGMSNIVPAMKKHGIRRIISLTGAGARAANDTPSLLEKINHFALGIIAPKILQDGEQHLQILKDSELDWTVIRSPVMKDGSNKGFVLDDKSPKPWETIERDDVVEAMVDMLIDDSFISQAPYIHHA